MFVSRFMKIGAVLAVVSAVSNPLAADQASASLEKPLRSAFEKFSWDIGDVFLGVDFPTTMELASPSTRLKTRTWVAKRVPRNQDPIAPHEEYAGAGFNSRSTPGVKDRTVLEATHWHTGSMVWLVRRTVQSFKPELMPTAEDLVASVIEKYGPDPKAGNKTTGAGGITQQSRGTLSYPVKNGARHDGPCFDSNMGIARTGAPSNVEYEAAKQLVADIRNGDLCDGVLVVLFAQGKLNRLREYQIIARDFLMEAENIVHDYETKIKILQAVEQNLPSVQPKL